MIRLLARTFAVLLALGALGCAALAVVLALTVWGIPAALVVGLLAWVLAASAATCWVAEF